MTVLTAIDNESGSEEIVSEGAELASGLGKRLVVLSVVPSEQDVEEAEQATEATVDAALEDPEMATISVRIGNPAHQILSTADDVDADYLVLGSRKRTPVGKVLFGSVTQLVLLNSDVPVVTVTQVEE